MRENKQDILNNKNIEFLNEKMASSFNITTEAFL